MTSHVAGSPRIGISYVRLFIFLCRSNQYYLTFLVNIGLINPSHGITYPILHSYRCTLIAHPVARLNAYKACAGVTYFVFHPLLALTTFEIIHRTMIAIAYIYFPNVSLANEVLLFVGLPFQTLSNLNRSFSLNDSKFTSSFSVLSPEFKWLSHI
jgi:hypothetical protein